MRFEAKVTFTMQYEANLKFYNGATTAKEVIALDLKGAIEDPLGFLDLEYNRIDDNIDVTAKIVEIK